MGSGLMDSIIWDSTAQWKTRSAEACKLGGGS